MTHARLLLALALALTACSGSVATVADGPGGSDGGPGSADSGVVPGADAGSEAAAPDAGRADGAVPDVIWPSTATRLVAESPGGGHVPPKPPGSECASGQQRFVLVIPLLELTFERCEMGKNSTDPYKLLKGSRVISGAEYATIDQAMKKLTPPKSTACGADKPELRVTVTSPAGDRTYHDSFYQCMDPKKVYVDEIDGVFAAFNALVKTK